MFGGINRTILISNYGNTINYRIETLMQTICKTYDIDIFNSLLSLQIAQSMGLDIFKVCYLNYKLYDHLSHKYIDSPNVW